MINNVLIAIDDDLNRSMRSAEHAVDIAKGVGAHVTLLHVYDKERFEDQLDQFGLDSADPTNLVKRNKTIRDVAAVFAARNVLYNLAGAVGSPAHEIISYVDENDIDHVFLGGRRQSPAGKVVLGSVSQQVLLAVKPPCTISISD